MTTLALTPVNSLFYQASTCLRMGSKFRCIRSTPTAMQSMSENDFECSASTGVKKKPVTLWDKVSEFCMWWASTSSKPTSARNDFRVARDLGVVERMIPSQVRAAVLTVGLPRPRCTEDTGSGC